MRKSIVIILAVAIIGALGIFAKGQHKDAASTATPTTASSSTLGSSTSTPASQTATAAGLKDGTYNGGAEDTPYGTVQVAAVVSGGKITDIQFLQMPNDRGHTQEVTAFSEPLLKQETLQKQSAHIDFVSGATQTSEAYEQSLQAALNQAAVS
jgi:uncharacterized protein with FMN-binding domain